MIVFNIVKYSHLEDSFSRRVKPVHWLVRLTESLVKATAWDKTLKRLENPLVN